MSSNLISKYIHFYNEKCKFSFEPDKKSIVLKTPQRLVPFRKEDPIGQNLCDIWNKRLFSDCQFAELKFKEDNLNLKNIITIKCKSNLLIPEHLILAYGSYIIYFILKVRDITPRSISYKDDSPLKETDPKWFKKQNFDNFFQILQKGESKHWKNLDENPLFRASPKRETKQKKGGLSSSTKKAVPKKQSSPPSTKEPKQKSESSSPLTKESKQKSESPPPLTKGSKQKSQNITLSMSPQSKSILDEKDIILNSLPPKSNPIKHTFPLPPKFSKCILKPLSTVIKNQWKPNKISDDTKSITVEYNEEEAQFQQYKTFIENSFLDIDFISGPIGKDSYFLFNLNSNSKKLFSFSNEYLTFLQTQFNCKITKQQQQEKLYEYLIISGDSNIIKIISQLLHLVNIDYLKLSLNDIEFQSLSDLNIFQSLNQIFDVKCSIEKVQNSRLVIKGGNKELRDQILMNIIAIKYNRKLTIKLSNNILFPPNFEKNTSISKNFTTSRINDSTLTFSLKNPGSNQLNSIQTLLQLILELFNTNNQSDMSNNETSQSEIKGKPKKRK